MDDRPGWSAGAEAMSVLPELSSFDGLGFSTYAPNQDTVMYPEYPIISTWHVFFFNPTNQWNNIHITQGISIVIDVDGGFW